ncbi:MAG: hypothetical protein E7128_00930 [Rikenellaceae bacterium]|nr:hypothetical protein [Rikenellaceae bacterium]
MKNIKKIFLTAMLSLVAFGASAQLKTSYFMEGSTYRYDMNPALTPIRGYIKLPALNLFSMNMDNNLLSIDRFLFNKNGETVTFLHKSVTEQEFLKKFKRDNNMGIDLNVPLLGFGDYGKHYFWSFDLNLRAMGNVSVPRDMFRMIKSLGNGTCDMGNLRFDLNSYMQASLGFTFPIGEHVITGLKVKGLLGLAHATANLDNLKLSFSEERITASAHGYIEAGMAGINLNKVREQGDKYTLSLGGSDSEEEGTGGDEMPDLSDALEFNIADLPKTIKNGGFAIDLGVEVNLLQDQLHLSASVIDLGWIWYKNSASFSTNTIDATWEGANLSQLINGEDFDVLKELKGNYSEIVLTNTGKNTVVSRLATQLNVGAEYGFLKNKISIGLLSHTKFYESHTYSELTASLNLRAGKWFSASFSHSFLNNGLQSMGFAINIHPKGFNLFLGTDYIPLGFAKLPAIEDLPIRISLPVDNFGLSFYAGISFSLHEAHYGKTNKEVRLERKAARKAAKME